jgi:hypothetical protein
LYLMDEPMPTFLEKVRYYQEGRWKALVDA